MKRTIVMSPTWCTHIRNFAKADTSFEKDKSSFKWRDNGKSQTISNLTQTNLLYWSQIFLQLFHFFLTVSNTRGWNKISNRWLIGQPLVNNSCNGGLNINPLHSGFCEFANKSLIWFQSVYLQQKHCQNLHFFKVMQSTFPGRYFVSKHNKGLFPWTCTTSVAIYIIFSTVRT